MEDISQIEKLPFVEVAMKLPKFEFDKLAKSFMSYSAYCDSILIPDKIQDWCLYLGCKNEQCSYDFKESVVTRPSIIPTRYTTAIPKHCFDIFFCPPIWTSDINYYCFGIMCLLFLVIALVMNIIYIPSFTLYGQRKGTDFLLTILSFCDILLIVIFIYIDCLPFTKKSLKSQVSMYSTYVAVLIPYLLPFQSFLQTMSSWILCCLLFERYLYQQHGKHAKLIFSTRTIIFTILSIGIIVFGFTILKFFGMTSIHGVQGNYSVHYTKIGLNDNYHNLITNWLKVPLEYFGPLLAFVSLLSLIYTSLGEQGIAINKPAEQKMPNYRSLIKNLVIINESEREDRVLISVLLMSTIAIVVKLPRFVYHILVNEEANISFDKLHYLMMSYIILDAIFMVAKPFIYVYISPNYCRSIQRYFVGSLPANDTGEMAMTFEESIATKMRESISYRGSVWATTPDSAGDSVNTNNRRLNTN